MARAKPVPSWAPWGADGLGTVPHGAKPTGGWEAMPGSPAEAGATQRRTEGRQRAGAHPGAALTGLADSGADWRTAATQRGASHHGQPPAPRR